jgi:hypothetical protein
MITGAAVLGERTVNSGAKVLDVTDNMLDMGIKKSDNMRKRAALQDDATYMLDIVSLIKANPEVGAMYLADPELLPEGISMDVLQSMLDGNATMSRETGEIVKLNKPVRRRVVQEVVKPAVVSGRSTRSSRFMDTQSEY